MVWQPQVEIMEIDICTCSTQCTSTALPIFHHPSNHVLTSYTQSSLPNQVCSLHLTHPLTANFHCSQICMLDMGRPSVGTD
jgi:hypothetical protein